MGCNDNSDNITCDLTGYPAQGDYTTWENIANEVSGVGATLVGKPYQVYRITSASNGDVIQPANLIFPNFFLDRQKDDGSDPGRETLGNDVFWYKLLADLTLCQTGDVFIQNDPFFGVGHTITPFATTQFVGLGLAEYEALKNPIAGRLDRNIQVFRPSTGPNNDGYWDSTLQGAECLVCTAGVFSLVSQIDNVPSYIPCGLNIDRKSRGPIIADTPNVPTLTRWNAYVIPLPGFTFREGDIIVTQQGEQYQVENPYYQETGVQGAQLTLTRYVAQP